MPWQQANLKNKNMNPQYNIGILAFGSLIDNPGEEIECIEIDRIDCQTPFNIEFARISNSRGKAPTLIPIFDGSKGRKNKANIIILQDNTTLNKAKSILWRRECHKHDKSLQYNEPPNPSSKNVLIGEYDNLCGVEKVIYTYFLPQIEYRYLTPEKLANYAIKSILSDSGKNKKDGIRYLHSIKNHGIETEYSPMYEEYILQKTNTKSLQEAIKFLDQQRESKNEI